MQELSFDNLIDQLLEIYSSFKKNKNVLELKKYNNLKIHNIDSTYINKKNIDSNDDYICVICLNKFLECDKINILICQHHFHIKCLKKWLIKYNNSCPICRIIIK